MKNKKIVKATALILTSSLVIAGGAGTLGLTMAKAQQETITKEVESETDSVEDGTEIGEGVTLQEGQADSEVKESEETSEESSNEVKLNETEDKESEERDSQEKEDENSDEKSGSQEEEDENPDEKSSSQPKLVEKKGESGEEEVEYEQFQKSWKDFDITFIIVGTKTKKGDLEITDALEKAVKYVKENSGKTITGGKVEIQLTDGMGDVVAEYSEADVYDSDDYVFARKYQITFNPGTDDETGVTMNAVTGEIYGIRFMMKDEKQ